MEILTFYMNFNKSQLSNWEFRTTTWLQCCSFEFSVGKPWFIEIRVEGQNFHSEFRTTTDVALNSQLESVNCWISCWRLKFPSYPLTTEQLKEVKVLGSCFRIIALFSGDSSNLIFFSWPSVLVVLFDKFKLRESRLLTFKQILSKALLLLKIAALFSCDSWN